MIIEVNELMSYSHSRSLHLERDFLVTLPWGFDSFIGWTAIPFTLALLTFDSIELRGFVLTAFPMKYRDPFTLRGFIPQAPFTYIFSLKKFFTKVFVLQFS